MSKVLMFPVPSEEIRGGLYSVVNGALAGGAPSPSWIAVDDGSDAWVAEILNRSAVDRARSVIAAGGDLVLVKALRLGVGGAMRLPPSSLGALDAFAAADAAEPQMMPDSVMLGLIDGEASLRLATVKDRTFWRNQLGDPALMGLLVELAAALEVPASLLPWPALIVAERGEAEIVERWGQVTPASAGLEVQILPFCADGGDVIEAAFGALLERAPTTPFPDSGDARPVHELPHGRRVGWWSRGTVDPEEGGWLATPIEISPWRCRWRLEGVDRSGIVADVLTAEEVSELEGVAAVRLPGWASRSLRPGSPAGLLAARIAGFAARQDLPFWIPGIDEEALRFVLGLPGTIWVDGPAVPK